ncbi:hypothetical protein BpHYR1_033390 [Brachionus plicatilis]|uniref:Uncharacterized protein n=1 Tax=Brachionus plicatilis TaxID=10195 RepID=A0A3M7P9D4_BRAPC|nr:hypothetical protein BpHYR1_033390 [Brachionus plicatilis]
MNFSPAPHLPHRICCLCRCGTLAAKPAVSSTSPFVAFAAVVAVWREPSAHSGPLHTFWPFSPTLPSPMTLS